ncbi:MAG: Reverse transcriptase domain-containing protein [Lachnoclostridium sp.]
MAVQSAELYAITTKQAEKNVRNLQRRLVKAATVRDTKLVKKLIRLMLHSYSCKVVAVEQVTRKNKGKNTAGVDGITITTDQERLIAVSRKYQRVRKYPVKRVYIPKKNGEATSSWNTYRIRENSTKNTSTNNGTLILGVGSRNSYGFRPGRCTRDCLEIMWLCTGTTQGKRILIDGDIQGCFDNISHDTLMELLTHTLYLL